MAKKPVSVTPTGATWGVEFDEKQQARVASAVLSELGFSDQARLLGRLSKVESMTVETISMFSGSKVDVVRSLVDRMVSLGLVALSGSVVTLPRKPVRTKEPKTKPPVKERSQEPQHRPVTETRSTAPVERTETPPAEPLTDHTPKPAALAVPRRVLPKF